MNLVRRRCLVCDAEQDVLESSSAEEIGSACASCGAPTERITLLRSGLHAKSPHAVALGHLGGIKGGRARAEALSAQRRREIAKKAATARWKRAKR